MFFPLFSVCITIFCFKVKLFKRNRKNTSDALILVVSVFYNLFIDLSVVDALVRLLTRIFSIFFNRLEDIINNFIISST
jgi:hypothetical protein